MMKEYRNHSMIIVFKFSKRFPCVAYLWIYLPRTSLPTLWSRREISQLKSAQSLHPLPKLWLLQGNRITESICRMHGNHCIRDSRAEKMRALSIRH